MPRCFHSSPVRTRSMNAAKACDGAGSAMLLITPVLEPASQRAMIRTNTKGATPTIRRCRKPPPRNGTWRVRMVSSDIGQLHVGLAGFLTQQEPDPALDPVEFDDAVWTFRQRHVDLDGCADRPGPSRKHDNPMSQTNRLGQIVGDVAGG